MGMFYIYTNIDPNDLIDCITYSNIKIEYNDDIEWQEKPQIIKCDYFELEDIEKYLIIAEYLPDEVIIYSNYFLNKTEYDWDKCKLWLDRNNFKKCTNLYLKECYYCLEYAIEGINNFKKAVAQNKAEFSLLQGD